MAEHLSGSEHRELYSKSSVETNKFKTGADKTTLVENSQKMVEPNIDNNSETKKNTPAEGNFKILKAVLVNNQSTGININPETETNVGNKKSDVIPFECVEIEENIENHSRAEKSESDLLYTSAIDLNLSKVNFSDETADKTVGPKTGGVKDENQKYVTDNSEGAEENARECDKYEKNNSKFSQSQAYAFAQENQLMYEEESREAYCRICAVILPSSSFKSMKDHVSGTNHKKMAETTEANPENPVQLMKEKLKYYTDSLHHITSLLSDEIIINEKFCITRKSFNFISQDNPICFLCEEDVPSNQSCINAHIETEQHIDQMGNTLVILSEESELIREIRPELYHCGTCNLVFSGWDQVEKHLKWDSDHKLDKSFWGRHLESYLPAIQELKHSTDSPECRYRRMVAALSYAGNPGRSSDLL